MSDVVTYWAPAWGWRGRLENETILDGSNDYFDSALWVSSVERAGSGR
ncbi:MAG: hypothetical protein NXI19_12575 [Alphaproteobacteria bacterium]|jgi:hypothetical protein|nr:hypothetical protein [Alphaproteobacteria bacterium]